MRLQHPLPSVFVAALHKGALPQLARALQGLINQVEDIVKAHALGATAACSGRCWFWGLAANGEQGVTDVLEILNQETKDTLSLVGQRNLRDVGAHNLYRS